MAQECRIGTWLFRIDPSNNTRLQRGNTGSTSYSHLWAAPNGERILDLATRGNDLVIETDRRTYVRNSSGNIRSM